MKRLFPDATKGIIGMGDVAKIRIIFELTKKMLFFYQKCYNGVSGVLSKQLQVLSKGTRLLSFRTGVLSIKRQDSINKIDFIPSRRPSSALYR